MLAIRWTVLASFLALAACRAGPPGASPPSHGAADSPSWPFWPDKMRIHPLTRVVMEPESERLHIETRIEFTDHDEVTSRCFGEMLLSLQGRPAVRRDWRIDLRPLEDNANHFDEVTRTYLFRLALEEGVPFQGGRLFATFLSVDGRRLTGTFEVELE